MGKLERNELRVNMSWAGHKTGQDLGDTAIYQY